MDEIKDIQRTDSLSRFLDEHVVRTNPFGDNRAADRAYRRAERMSAALHMLTAHIDATEPIRHAIRSAATAMLRSIIEVRSDMRSLQSRGVVHILSELRYVISQLRLATVSGYISVQNATTMIEALDDLGSFISASQRSALSEDISISREELTDVGMPASRQAIRRTISRLSDRKAITDRTGTGAGVQPSHSSSNSLRDLSSRVQNILEILKTGGSLGIRDISANLPEYSEKMIQRELLELVSEGRVKKEGLKRWSRYSLVA